MSEDIFDGFTQSSEAEPECAMREGLAGEATAAGNVLRADLSGMVDKAKSENGTVHAARDRALSTRADEIVRKVTARMDGMQTSLDERMAEAVAAAAAGFRAELDAHVKAGEGRIEAQAASFAAEVQALRAEERKVMEDSRVGGKRDARLAVAGQERRA